MNGTPDLEARLTRFLVDDAPAHAPERLVDGARARVAGTAQRRRLGALGGRLSTSMLVPAGAVAVVAIAVLGTAMLFGGGPGPSVGSRPSAPAPSASPSGSPSPSMSPSPFPCPSGQGTCLNLLQPGTHRSSSFAPAVNYTVAGGWANTLDLRGELDLSYATGGHYTYPDGTTFHDGISIFRKPVAESTTSKTRAPGVGATANDLAQWLVAHPGLAVTAPTQVSIGGATGFRLTLTVPAGTRATDHCATDHGEPRCASLFISSDPAANYGFGVVGPEIADVFLLDVPSGDTVMVVIDDVDGIDQPALEVAAMPIVNSLSFSP
jgi:hypothetical protein